MDSVSKPSLTSGQIFRLVEKDLKKVEARLKTEATSSLPLMREMNVYLHEGGGKRLRPSLLLLVAKLCGASSESQIQLGAVVELIHVATLVHDDIIDNSGVRRGRASLNAKWGNELTVLFGDWLYMTAFWVALKLNDFRILNVLIDITRKMVEGEVLQLELRHKLRLSLDEHLRVCWLKTAHLFSGCGRLGAMLGGVGEEAEESFANYGKALGMAFQLTDDLLDYTASEKVLGKPVLKDLEEGNVTLPIISLLEKADRNDCEFIERVVRERDFSPENKGKIISMVESYGTILESETMASQYAREAEGFLEKFPDSRYKQALMELPGLVLSRRK